MFSSLMFGGGEILFLLAMLVLLPLCLAAFAFWIWMLIDAITNKSLTDTEKLVWVLVILFVHFIGAIIYFFVGRRKADGPGAVPPRMG